MADNTPTREAPSDSPDEAPSASPDAASSTTPAITEEEVLAALEMVLAQLPDGEPRPGQVEMARAVLKAFNSKEHLLVEAGTGVGKSLAYLVPAALLASKGKGNQVVISTATKVLQDQLAKKDLPQVCGALEGEMLQRLGRSLRFAVLKGRDNYACQLRLAQHTDQRTLPEMAEVRGKTTNAKDRAKDRAKEKARAKLLADLVAWAKKTKVGDRAEFDIDPSANDALADIWPQVSVSSRECVGKKHCEFGETCFTEVAREKATEADIIVTNHALYTLTVTSLDVGALLPPHNFVIIDEAHRLEAAATDSTSTALSPRRFEQLANQASQVARSGSELDGESINALRRFSTSFRNVLAGHLGQRLSLDASRHNPDENIYAAQDVADELRRADGLLENLIADLDAANASAGGSSESGGSTEQSTALGPKELSPEETSDAVLKNSLNATLAEVRALAEAPTDTAGGDATENFVAYVSGTETSPSLWISPISVGDILEDRLWPDRCAVLTSATIGSSLAEQLGIPETSASETADGETASDKYVHVESPFDFRSNGLLYVAKHLPRPSSGDSEVARRKQVVELMLELINAAGGRTLSLFTSWDALEETADALEEQLDGSLTLLRQPRRQSNPHLLLNALQEDPQTVICATRSLWEGIDIAGPALSLLIIDRLPFDYQLNPMIKARSELAEAAGKNPFREVMIPPAATLLAQGIGRLIRTTTDRGVVAVMDSRLAKMDYRHQLLESVPPMKRSIKLSEAIEFLEGLD